MNMTTLIPIKASDVKNNYSSSTVAQYNNVNEC